MNLCPQCKREFTATTSALNRAAKLGAPRYCGRACAGLARRSEPKSDEQKRAEKAAYDREYRARNSERIKAGKATWYRENFDREKEAAYRKQRMPQHVAYCQRPEYKAWKASYDEQYRAAEYGEFAEAYRLLVDLDKEIRSQATAYERRVANGYYTRNAQKRRRELWQIRKSLNSTQAT